VSASAVLLQIALEADAQLIAEHVGNFPLK
jgi:hypothetical protein